MKPAFLVDLRVYRDYLMRTFRIALVITVFGCVPNSKCLCSMILVYGVSRSV